MTMQRGTGAAVRRLAIGAVLAIAIATSGVANAGDLTVQVTGVRGDKGLIRLCLWVKSESFPDCQSDRRPLRLRAPAQPGTVSAVFHNIAPGLYAVSAFHDEIGDDVLHRNFIGIPSDGLGVSNDARGTFGPPSFDAAAFAMPEGDRSIAITLSYR